RVGVKTRAGRYLVPGTGGIFVTAVIPGIGTAAFHQLLPYHALCIGNVQLYQLGIVYAAQKNFGQRTTIHRTAYNLALYIIGGICIVVAIVKKIDNGIGLGSSKSFHLQYFCKPFTGIRYDLIYNIASNICYSKGTGIIVRVSIV